MFFLAIDMSEHTLKMQDPMYMYDSLYRLTPCMTPDHQMCFLQVNQLYQPLFLHHQLRSSVLQELQAVPEQQEQLGQDLKAVKVLLSDCLDVTE